MTLLVALLGSDGLVLAADSRGTFGDPRGVTAQNDSMQKAHVLAPHAAALVAGSGELGDLIIEQVRQEVGTQAVDGVTPVMNILRTAAIRSYDEWFPTVPPMQPQQMVMTGQVAVRPDLALIVAGYDGDTPHVYHLASQLAFAPMLSNYGFALQGVAQYALYLLNRLYEADRTVEELTPLAVYVITETASQDGKVGGPVKVITVRPDDRGCEALDSAAVDMVMATNEQRSKTLRDSFYERGEVPAG
jgi:20S proteasome alpha/beta subunit